MITRRGVLGVLAALVPAVAAGRVNAAERKEDGLRKLPDGLYLWDIESTTAPLAQCAFAPSRCKVTCDGNDVRRVTWCDTNAGVLEYIPVDDKGHAIIHYTKKRGGDGVHSGSIPFPMSCEVSEARLLKVKMRGRIEVFEPAEVAETKEWRYSKRLGDSRGVFVRQEKQGRKFPVA